MKINKFESSFQKIRYTKLYRLPKWIVRKLKFLNADPLEEQSISMRIGHTISLFPTQNYLKSTLLSRQYHDENIFLAGKFLKANPVILDIGANIGLYSCAYAQYYKKLNPTIYAIEAVNTNYKLLTQNISKNKFSNIHPIHIALGEKPGYLEFNLPSKDFTGNFVGNNINSDINSGNNQVTEKVELDTLDNLVTKYKITRCDFMKVDIEGAELYLFKGAREFISKNRPVIQFEYNKYWLESNSITFRDFVTFFKELDYVFYLEKNDYFLKIENLSTYIINADLIDLLIIPYEKHGDINFK